MILKLFPAVWTPNFKFSPNIPKENSGIVTIKERENFLSREETVLISLSYR